MENLVTLQKRILYLIDNKQLSCYRISQDTGISEGTLSKITSGKTKKLSNNTLLILSKYLNVNPQWLQNGIGEMRNQDDVKEQTINNEVTIDRDVLKTIISQQETIHSQQQLLEKLITAVSQKDARLEDPAECADAAGA